MAVQSTRAGTETTRRVYDPMAISTDAIKTDDGLYTQVSWAGLSSTDEPGLPQLPVEYIRFLVPVYTNNFSVSLGSIAVSDGITLKNRVMPGQQPVSTNHEGDIHFTKPNNEAYSEGTQIRAEVMDDGYLDGCNHIVTVAVHPIAYSDKEGKLTVASSMYVILSYDECGEDEVNGTPILPPHRSKYLDLESLVVNSQRLNSAKYAMTNEWKPEEPEYYYIITSRGLVPAFDDLARWKRQKGYHVVVEAMEDIYQRFPVGSEHRCRYGCVTHSVQIVDSATSLRTYLQHEYMAHGAFFCLLAGDWNTSVPIRKAYRPKCNVNDEIQNPDNPNFVPTDNYFSDLTTNYELFQAPKSDIQVFESNKYTYQPDITIGRLLCHKSKEVDIYFHKLKLYEANPGYGDSNYLNNAFVFLQNDMKGEDAISFGTYNPFLNMEIQQDHTTTGQSDFGPSGAETIQKMSMAGYTSWHGHGSPVSVAVCKARNSDHFKMIASLDSTDSHNPSGYAVTESNNGLENMTNRNKPGIAYSISCDNAPYGNFEDLKLEDGYHVYYHHYLGIKYDLAQSYTIGGNYGGVAFLANTRNGYVLNSSYLESAFLQSLKSESKIGIAENDSKILAVDMYNKNVSKYLCETHNLIGDPELEMWLHKPETINLNIVQDGLGLYITGDECTGARICAYSDGEEPLFINSATCSSFTLPYGFREYCVSVWKPGYLPYVRLFANSGGLANETRKYVVRDADIGLSPNYNSEYKISAGGILIVNALDKISVGHGLEIESGGVLYLECDQSISLNEFTLRKGGTLVVYAKDIQLGTDVTIEQGAKVQLNIRK